jgi:hypothetical protein
MTRPEEVVDFFLKQKSTVASIKRFIEQFMSHYLYLDKEGRDIAAHCVHQMFRRYYYSPLIQDTAATPANFINTLVHREFGPGVMVVPALRVKSDGEGITGIDFDVACVQEECHYAVRDFESLLDKAASGIALEECGVLTFEEAERLRHEVFITDSNYVRFLGLVALEGGLLDRVPSGTEATASVTSKINDFLSLGERGKLTFIINAAMCLCSRMMAGASPTWSGEFTTPRISDYLENPCDMDDIFERSGIDPDELNERVLSGEIETLPDEETQKILEVGVLLPTFGLFFTAPFSYYLQLLQPLHLQEFNMGIEMDNLIGFNEPKAARLSQFLPADIHDLTPLGEEVLAKGRRVEKCQELDPEVSDEDMYEILECLEDDDEMSELDDLGFDDFAEMIREVVPGSTAGLKRRKKREPKQPTWHPHDDKIFVFRVKVFEYKRIWRDIEIRGDRTLDDLHEAIQLGYPLDPGHLYAFFLSNRMWDGLTEYSHPEADGRSAARAQISRLGLEPKKKFKYVYDFGDSHKFEVELKNIKDPEEGVEYPRETKRNKPKPVPCGACNSGEPSTFYCYDHDMYLCEACSDSEEHKECYLEDVIA